MDLSSQIPQPRPPEDGYERYAHYLQHADKLDALAPYLAAEIVRRFAGRRETVRIVDVGAGTGRIIASLLDVALKHQLPIEVHAFERSPQALKKLDERFAADDRVKLIPEPFPPSGDRMLAQADLLLASHVMYYFPCLHDFVQACFAMLRPGGLVLMVAASQTLLENPIYQSVLPVFLSMDAIRTTETDGQFSFAEDIVPALIEAGSVPGVSVLASSITFTPACVQEAVDSLRLGRGEESDLMRAFSFLWRYPPAVLASRPGAWLEFLGPLAEHGQGIRLDYEDKVLSCPAPHLKEHSQ